MTAQQDLAGALASAFRKLEGGNGKAVPALDLPKLSVDLPGMGGRCILVPHSPDTPPLGAVVLAYVKTKGGGNQLRCAFWMDGEWKGRNLKPLKGEIEVWYHVEGEQDG